MSRVEVNNAEPTSVVACSLRQQLEGLRDSLRVRAYELFEAREPNDGGHLDDWLHAEKDLLTPMQCDEKRSENNYSISLSVPGFDAKDLEVYTVGESLIVKGGKTIKSSDARGLYMNEGRSVFYQWPIPAGATVLESTADLKNDLLTITMPIRPELTLAQTA